jgi:ribose transport system substrate-binding protein
MLIGSIAAKQALLGGVGIAACAVFLSVASPAAAEEKTVDIGADITKMCGTKPVRVGVADGYGGNTWRKIVLAEIQDEAAKCPNIKEVVYLDAAGDPQKYNGNINSLVAQNFDVILTVPDFGEASFPAYRSAIKAGVVVVPYLTALNGTQGRDFSANVALDLAGYAKLWADWYGKNVKEGKLLFFGGIPGASTSNAMLKAFKEGMAKYPGLSLIEDDFIQTNWNQTDAQKATAAMIAKYSKIDGIITDYGPPTIGVIRAFKQAGLPVPNVATATSNAELFCMYTDDQAAGKGWNFFSIDGATILGRYALRRGVSIVEGTENPDPTTVTFPVHADTFAGIAPPCDKTVPLDADLASSLPLDVLKKKLQE